MERLVSNLIGGIVVDSDDKKFRIIEIRHSGVVILKDKLNNLHESTLRSINDYKLNLDLNCE